jgi:hypothetical protein
MKSILISLIALAIALAATGSSAFGGKKEKIRNWQIGRLLDSQRSKDAVGAVDRPPIGFDNRHRTSVVYQIQDTFVIETDKLTYTVSEIVQSGKPANLTVNGPVKFAIEDTTLYLMDESGKEHRTEIVKKVLRQPSEPPN